MQKLKQIWSKIMAFFGRVQDIIEDVRPKAKIAVEFVNKVKDFVNGYASDIVALTPSEKDDKIVAQVKIILAKVSAEMLEAEGVLGQNQTQTSAILALIEYLKRKPALARIKWYIELAGRIIQALSNNKLSLGAATAHGQEVYETQNV